MPAQAHQPPIQQQLTLHQFEESFKTQHGRKQLTALISTPEGRRQVALVARDPGMPDACGRVFSDRNGVKHFSQLAGSKDGVETMKLIYGHPASADNAMRVFKNEGGKKAVGWMFSHHPLRSAAVIRHQVLSDAGTNPPGAPLDSTHLGSNKKGAVCDAHNLQITDKLRHAAPQTRLETACEFFRRPEKTRMLVQYLKGDASRAPLINQVLSRNPAGALEMISRVCNSDTGFQNLAQFMREHPASAGILLAGVVPAEKLGSAHELRKHLFKSISPPHQPYKDHLRGGRLTIQQMHEIFSLGDKRSFEAFSECFSSDAKLRKFKNYLHARPDSLKTIVTLLTHTPECVEKTVGAFESALASEGGARRLAEMIADSKGAQVMTSLKRTDNGSLEISSLLGKTGGREALRELYENLTGTQKLRLLVTIIRSALVPAKPETTRH